MKENLTVRTITGLTVETMNENPTTGQTTTTEADTSHTVIIRPHTVRTVHTIVRRNARTITMEKTVETVEAITSLTTETTAAAATETTTVRLTETMNVRHTETTAVHLMEIVNVHPTETVNVQNVRRMETVNAHLMETETGRLTETEKADTTTASLLTEITVRHMATMAMVILMEVATGRTAALPLARITTNVPGLQPTPHKKEPKVFLVK